MIIRKVTNSQHTRHRGTEQAITRSIADCARTIRVPVHVLESKNKMSKATVSLFQELGKEPNIEEISLKAGLP